MINNSKTERRLVEVGRRDSLCAQILFAIIAAERVIHPDDSISDGAIAIQSLIAL